MIVKLKVKTIWTLSFANSALARHCLHKFHSPLNNIYLSSAPSSLSTYITCVHRLPSAELSFRLHCIFRPLVLQLYLHRYKYKLQLDDYIFPFILWQIEFVAFASVFSVSKNIELALKCSQFVLLYWYNTILFDNHIYRNNNLFIIHSCFRIPPLPDNDSATSCNAQRRGRLLLAEAFRLLYGVVEFLHQLVEALVRRQVEPVEAGVGARQPRLLAHLLDAKPLRPVRAHQFLQKRIVRAEEALRRSVQLTANPPTGTRHVPVTNCSNRVRFSLSDSRTNWNESGR